jgi:hypothetical protein
MRHIRRSSFDLEGREPSDYDVRVLEFEATEASGAKDQQSSTCLPIRLTLLTPVLKQPYQRHADENRHAESQKAGLKHDTKQQADEKRDPDDQPLRGARLSHFDSIAPQTDVLHLRHIEQTACF